MQQEKKKKERDPAAEAEALREFAVEGARCVDIGANLQGKNAFEECARLVERARTAGVEAVVLTGCDVEGSRKGAEYCERFAREGGGGLYCTAGVHPHEAERGFGGGGDALAALRALATESPFCVALGECGLDYDRMFSPREAQLAAFEAQARLAKELDMPLFVHVREADDGKPRLGAYPEAVGVLAKVGIDPRAVCVHCFTGNADDLRAVRDFGARVGLTGFVGIAKRNADTLAALRLALEVPALEALQRGDFMIETDAPFMSPDKTYLPNAAAKRLGIRGGKNEPAVLPAVARALADALTTDDAKVTATQVAQLTTAAARDFFRLDRADAAIAAALH